MKLTNEEAISIANLILPKKNFKVLKNEKGLYELVCKNYKENVPCLYTLIQIDTKQKSIYIAEKSNLTGVRSASYYSGYNLAIEYVKSTRAANLLMEYWDSIPDDEKQELNKKLTKLGF